MRSGVSERFFKISVENPVVVDVVNALAIILSDIFSSLYDPPRTPEPA